MYLITNLLGTCLFENVALSGRRLVVMQERTKYWLEHKLIILIYCKWECNISCANI
jgi:hypothetical protein